MQNTEDLSEYNTKMIALFQNTIKDNCLQISKNKELKSVSYIQSFNIRKLSFEICYYLIPKLSHQQIIELQIKECAVKTLEEFNLPNLELLSLINTQTQFYSLNLNNFTNLKELRINNNKLQFSSFLKQAGQKLIRLFLNDNQINSIQGIETLVNLEEVDLSNNRCCDISPICKNVKITKLILCKNSIKDLFALKELVNLRELDISKNKVESLSPLQNITNLTLLQIQENKIVDLTPLNSLINLKVLKISNNTIADVNSIRGLINIQGSLDMSYNNLIDLSSIFKQQVQQSMIIKSKLFLLQVSFLYQLVWNQKIIVQYNAQFIRLDFQKVIYGKLLHNINTMCTNRQLFILIDIFHFKILKCKETYIDDKISKFWSIIEFHPQIQSIALQLQLFMIMSNLQ
ncbi:leucine-rich_repeat domain-containing protein [Hexamita inflata]|uniref:Leucine-rich_repeat domain-containing protein n=1 Tax=Hexamita inflata TaxID=28002 RepID=A0ABP1HWS1_9EUKA